jgi:hypothetical protein
MRVQSKCVPDYLEELATRTDGLFVTPLQDVAFVAFMSRFLCSR